MKEEDYEEDGEEEEPSSELNHFQSTFHNVTKRVRDLVLQYAVPSIAGNQEFTTGRWRTLWLAVIDSFIHVSGAVSQKQRYYDVKMYVFNGF